MTLRRLAFLALCGLIALSALLLAGRAVGGMGFPPSTSPGCWCWPA
ncbi:hypothetical protein [Roseococcus microcysteis]|nr:hypothetical protein [Roseococcus microcysteis]